MLQQMHWHGDVEASAHVKDSLTEHEAFTRLELVDECLSTQQDAISKGWATP